MNISGIYCSYLFPEEMCPFYRGFFLLLALTGRKERNLLFPNIRSVSPRFSVFWILFWPPLWSPANYFGLFLPHTDGPVASLPVNFFLCHGVVTSGSSISVLYFPQCIAGIIELVGDGSVGFFAGRRYGGGGSAGTGVISIGASLWDDFTKRTVMPFISPGPEAVAVAVPSAKPTT